MNQSNAILRYLGSQNNFYFSDNIEESFLVDWVLETSNDLHGSKAYRAFFPSGTEEDVAPAVENFEKFNKQM